MTPAKVIARTSAPVFTIEDCRQQCEIVAIDGDSDDNATHPDDALLVGYLYAAVDAAEDFTGLAISPKTYEVAMDSFPSKSRFPFGKPYTSIEIPVSPFVSVVSFIAGDGSDARPLEQDVDYVLDDYGQFAKLRPIGSWPSFVTAVNGIKIQFAAGYELDSDGVSTMPAAIRQAIMLAVGDWYKNREDSQDKQQFELPNGSQSLLRPKRVRLGMA